MKALGRAEGLSRDVAKLDSRSPERRVLVILPNMVGRRASSRGFSLTELMVVVVIAGTLATVGVASLRKHMSSSRAVEALTMIQSIRAAQERHRSTRGVYLDVSQSGTWYPWDPAQSGNRNRRTTFLQGVGGTHPDNARWLTLNPTAPGPVRFGYQTSAGLPGQTMTAPAETVPGLSWPTPNEPWYVIQAVADADADGEVAFYLAYSINGEVYREHEGE